MIQTLTATAAAAVNRTSSDKKYRLASLGGLVIGKHISSKPDGGAHDTNPLVEAWGLRSGIYTPRQLVEGFAPLLDTVVYRLGKEDSPNAKPARARLLDNIAANLATDTREATLRLADPLDPSRKEMKDQANRIGESLVQWARETRPRYDSNPNPTSDSNRKGTATQFNPDMYLRSPCEGHLLTRPNVDLMFGDRSEPHLMQLFNEYMHQMVLLRDALLPFQNYQDVLIPIDGKAARGIRHLEPARAQFLAELLTKHTTQAAIVTYAKALLAPGLLKSTSPTRTRTVGYAFQYAHGLILPAFLAGGSTPLHLLMHVPAKLVDADTADSVSATDADANAGKNGDESAQPEISPEVSFDYNFQDYYAAPREEISPGPSIAASDVRGFLTTQQREVSVKNVQIVVGNDTSDASVRHLQLQLDFANNDSVAIDLGQIARGHRYAHFADHDCDLEATGISPVIIHDTSTVLNGPNNGPGLLTAKNGGFHVLPTTTPAVALALLGKIYPENVILLPQDDDLVAAERAGKGKKFTKFVIWGGVRRGGRGLF